MEETKDFQNIDEMDSSISDDIKEIDLDSINPDEIEDDVEDDDVEDDDVEDDDVEDDDVEDDEGDEDDDEGDDDDEDDDDDDDSDKNKSQQKVIQQLETILATQPNVGGNDDVDDDDYESDDEDYLEKFDNDIKDDIIKKYHPDLMQSNYDEISALTKIIRDEQGNIVDPIHNTIPILTKFERARILGLRAKQINNGADPFIQVPDNVIEGHIIAQLELEQRVLPFIIVRPLPNGKKEYWRIQDLKLIDY